MNFGTPVPLLLGIILIIGAVALFFLDKIKPGYERDYDKVYAVLCLLSGMFLLGHLTMELIPSFQQILMVGMLIALMIQNIRSRSPNGGRVAQQPDMGVPPNRDSYRPSRPSSRSAYRSEGRRASVRAELEQRDLAPYDEPAYRPGRPMLGGRGDQPSAESDYYGDRDGYYGQEGYRQPEPYQDDYGSGDRPEAYDPYSSSDSYPASSSRYGSRKPDERIRTRRPLKLRGDSDRYRRLKPGDPSGRRD